MHLTMHQANFCPECDQFVNRKQSSDAIKCLPIAFFSSTKTAIYWKNGTKTTRNFFLATVSQIQRKSFSKTAYFCRPAVFLHRAKVIGSHAKFGKKNFDSCNKLGGFVLPRRMRTARRSTLKPLFRDSRRYREMYFFLSQQQTSPAARVRNFTTSVEQYLNKSFHFRTLTSGVESNYISHN